MSQITLELINLDRAPWGLFTDTEPPVRIVWLTHIQPKAVVDEALLSESDVQRIANAVNIGMLNQTGLDIEPIEMTQSEAMREDMARVSRLARGPSKEDQITSRYPQINEILNGHHNTVKKRLRELAASGTGLRFFLDCKEIELKRETGPRDSVLDFILDIIDLKTQEVTSDHGVDRISGSSLLADAYYAMIDESDDDEEEEE